MFFYVNFYIQKRDHLLVKAGIHPKYICELRGDDTLEVCANCDALRVIEGSVSLLPSRNKQRHLTGRKCKECGFPLLDTLVRKKEVIPEEILQRSYAEAAKADLCLVIGSDVTSYPAAHFPDVISEHGKVVIVSEKHVGNHTDCTLIVFLLVILDGF